MKKRDTYFMLFACCLPVNGHQRGAIYDLQRGIFKYVPNVFYELLQLTNTKTIDEIKTIHGNGSDKVIDDFFSALVAEQWGFYTNRPELYPPLSMAWHYPSAISSCIAEYNAARPAWHLPGLLQQLQQLQTVALHLRLFDVTDHETVTGLLPHLKTSSLGCVEIMMNWFPGMDIDVLLNCIVTEHRITKLMVHSVPPGTNITTGNKFVEFLQRRTVFTTQVLEPFTMPEKLKIESFIVNTEFFTEAHNYNPGLNRKLAVTINGDIKNHPAHERVLGHMDTHTLAQAVAGNELQRYWAVNPDHILRCKDCEYRYMCMDNTEVVNREGEWQKTAECPYDPYTATWR